MKKLEIKAPAKINLGLNVFEKRTDGYHNIETIFYPISLCDQLIFSYAETFSFRSNDKSLESSKDNSILKAVSLIEETIKKKLDVDIYLKKNIPIGAGMGGGSSDAAAALLALNEFFRLELSFETLTDLALLIGSDVPFFLRPLPSYASGRGEKLENIELDIPYPILIVNPGIHISTKWAYEHIILQKPVCNLYHSIQTIKNDFSKMKDLIVNDFESLVFKEFPKVKEIKDKIYESGAVYSSMTGSGSTVFGIFKNLESAKSAKKHFQQNNFTFIHKPVS